MESEKIYQESYKEVVKLIRDLSQDKITIDFKKLDSNTSTKIKEELLNCFVARSSEISKVIQGVK